MVFERRPTGFIERDPRIRSSRHLALSTVANSSHTPRMPPQDPSEVARLKKRLQVLEREASENKAALQNLAAETARTNSILEVAVDGILTIDETGTIESVNPAVGRMFGYQPGELIGQNVRRLMPAPFQQEHDQYLARYRKTGQRRIIGIGREVVGLRRDGTTFPLALAVSEGFANSRRFFTGMLRDLTERYDALEAQANLAAILENSLHEIFVFHADTLRFMQVNRGARENLGYTQQELTRLTPIDIKPELTHEEFVERIAPLKKGREETLVFETVHERRDGSRYPVEVHLQLGAYLGEPAFVALIFDLTERKKAIAEILLRDNALASASNGILICDASKEDLPVVYANPAATAMSGYPLDEMLGRNCRFLQGEDREQPGRYELCAAIAEGRETRTALRNYRKNGEMFWNELLLSPVRNEAGMVTHFIGIQSDITEKVETAERLRRSESRTREAERLASMATLTAGFAHDIGTPLNVIMGYAEMMESSLTDEKQIKRAQLIRDQSKRVTGLIQTLLNLSRPHEPNRIPLSLADTIDHAADFCSERFKKRGVKIERQLEDVPPVLGDSDQLEQVFLNLFVNAADAMPNGGTLRIELRPHEAGWIRVVVRDSGSGIAPDALERIFDPFFTTKEKGAGNGLGLMVSKGIIVAHGGEISVESTPGSGTEFLILLPTTRSD